MMKIVWVLLTINDASDTLHQMSTEYTQEKCLAHATQFANVSHKKGVTGDEWLCLPAVRWEPR